MDGFISRMKEGNSPTRRAPTSGLSTGHASAWGPRPQSSHPHILCDPLRHPDSLSLMPLVSEPWGHGDPSALSPVHTQHSRLGSARGRSSESTRQTKRQMNEATVWQSMVFISPRASLPEVTDVRAVDAKVFKPGCAIRARPPVLARSMRIFNISTCVCGSVRQA